MAKELLSNLVLMKVSTADDVTTNGLTIVCEEDSNVSGSSNVTERKTKCATFTGVDSPTYTISGSGVNVGDLTATEVSAQQLMQWLDAQTTIYFIYSNASDG